MKQSLNIINIHENKLNEFQKLKQVDLENTIALELDYLLAVGNIIFEYDTESNKEYIDTEKLSQLGNDYLYYAQDERYIIQDKINLYCQQCNERLFNDDVCRHCGLCLNQISITNTLSYKEMQETYIVNIFEYKKKTHLINWLKNFESANNKVISDEIIVKIRAEIVKYKIKICNIDEDKIRKILKNLKLNTYYKCVVAIVNILTDRPPFKLTIELREKIINMFDQIQEPFHNIINEMKISRKSFLSYPYFLSKFFYILKLPEFAKYFTLLKNNDKLRIQDEIFRKIVEHMQKVDSSVNWYLEPSF